MRAFIYKWLPIFFGCHCRKERSFHFRGIQFPICARCTGELVGMILFFCLCAWYIPNLGLTVLLMIPLLIDGFLQFLTSYESTNSRRFVTGLLFGYACACLFVKSILFVYHAGYDSFLERHGIEKNN